MPQSVTVRASDFSRNFAKYQDEAITAKVISVTSHGRVIGGFFMRPNSPLRTLEAPRAGSAPDRRSGRRSDLGDRDSRIRR